MPVRTATTSVWTRHLSRVAIRSAPPGSAAKGLAVLARTNGMYHRAQGVLVSGSPAGIAHSRANIGHLAAFDVSAVMVTTSPAASLPSLALDHRTRLFCGFGLDGTAGTTLGGYEAFSDDDGETWGDPTVMIANAKYYRVRAGKNGAGLLRLGWVDDGAGHTPATGVLKTTYQSPGDAAPSSPVTLTDQTGTVISAADSVPDLDHVAAGSSPWRMSVLEAGNTTPSEFLCHDETGAGWTRL